MASLLARAPSSASEPAVVGFVAGSNVAFDQERHSGQWLFSRRLGVFELPRDHERVGIERANGVELGSATVVSLYAREISFGQRSGGDLPTCQRLDDIAHRRVLESGLRLSADCGGIGASWFLHCASWMHRIHRLDVFLVGLAAVRKIIPVCLRFRTFAHAIWRVHGMRVGLGAIAYGSN